MESPQSKFLMTPKVSIAKTRFLWQAIPATMKTVRIIFGLVAVVLGAGCFEKPNRTSGSPSTILYRHHFLGTANLAHNTNNAKLAAFLAQPASRELGGQLAQKLAGGAAQLWRQFLPAGAPPPPAPIRPLLGDLMAARAFSRVPGPLHPWGSGFALGVPEERGGPLRTQLSSILN